MFVPFIFALDTQIGSDNYFHWRQFYKYAEACIENCWPIISHERYFEHLSFVEESTFGYSMRDVASLFCMKKTPTTEDMLTLKAYPISGGDEALLIAKYESQFDCWVDLLRNDSPEFERIIGELLDKLIDDYGERPEGILVYEFLPKALLKAACKREIPVIFQGGGIVRPPFFTALNAYFLLNSSNEALVRTRYNNFMSQSMDTPILSRKGILRLLVAKQYMSDIHNMDNEPEYDVGVLYNSAKVASYFSQEYVSDQEMTTRVKEQFKEVLIRTRPGYEPTGDALDVSQTCFHFCCKSKRVVGFSTKGVFEAMLARRIAHEYGTSLFHSFCNDGIEDKSKDVAPTEFLNFIIFGICTPFEWITSPDWLRFLLSNPTETEIYMRSLSYYTQRISNDDLKFYYMSDNRVYRLGDALYFTLSDHHKPHEYAAYYCTDGLHTLQADYTWSSGKITSFEFDLIEPDNESLIISVALYSVAMDWDLTSQTQTVSCRVNGVECGSVTLIPGKNYLRFNIPSECVKEKLRISFEYTHLLNSDGIEIAVAFERMYISYSAQRPIEQQMACEISGLEAQKVSLIASVSDLEMDKANLEERNASLDNCISWMETQTSGLELRNIELEAQIHGLNAQIEAIYGSRSWKLGNGVMKLASKIIPRKE